MSRSLTLADIADLRAYEREREDFRAEVIELKKRRRIAVGPHITVLFENRETVRFQIQEMARVEKLFTDDAISNELRAYNPLIPEPGHLSATMFVELTSDELLREWLPKLVGVQRSVEIRVAGSDPIACVPEAEHESFLTRDDITSSVHYIAWSLTDAQIDSLEAHGGTVAVDHPNYSHETAFTAENIGELLRDLRS